MGETFFDLLGIHPDATDAEVKQAYRARAKATHPDAGGSAVEFRAVQEAYETLETAHKRSLYRSWLDGQERRGVAAGPSIDDDMAVALLFHQLDAFQSMAIRELVKSLLWAGGAIGLSLFSWASAKAGGHYVILWGPAVYGAFRALRSISTVIKVSQLRRQLEAQIRMGG